MFTSQLIFKPLHFLFKPGLFDELLFEQGRALNSLAIACLEVRQGASHGAVFRGNLSVE